MYSVNKQSVYLFYNLELEWSLNDVSDHKVYLFPTPPSLPQVSVTQ